jgi:asparagine synthetase B (glutamine-hydrolysing)
MFFIAVSRHRAPTTIGQAELTSWSQGAFAQAGWTVHCLVDPLLGRHEPSPFELICGEHAPGDGTRMPLTTIRFDAARLLISLRREPDTGRTIYHHLARDGTLLLSSHLLLLRQWGIPWRESESLLPELLLYRHACAPSSMIEGVQQLVTGDRADVRLENDRWVLRRTTDYSPPSSDPTLVDFPTNPRHVARLRDAMTQAINRPGIDPSAVGCLTSGGLDSSIITSVLHRQGVNDTFSIVYPFEDIATDREFHYATTAAAAIGTRHEVHIPSTSDFLHGTIDAIAAAEQPTMHLQSVLIHLLCKDVLARRGCRIVPCGEGADGLFGGRLQRILSDFIESPWKRHLLGLPGVAPTLRAISRRTNRWGMIADIAGRRVTKAASVHDPRHILWSFAIFGDRDWIRRHCGCNDAAMIGSRPIAIEPHASRDLRDCVSMLALLSESSETQAIWSKLAEAQGMCFTYPYLDKTISDMAYSIPWETKQVGPKPIIRALARSLDLPDSIVARPKASFDVKPERWAVPGGVFEPLVSLAAPAFDEPALRSLQSSYVFKAQTLWTVINLAIWRRLHVQGEPLDRLHAELDQAMGRLGVDGLYRERSTRDSTG